MQKNLVKTETLAEFIARGGNINKVPTKGQKKAQHRANKEVAPQEEINFDLLPMALKIKYGAV